MGAGYIGILSVELHFPESGSLKGKRKYVKSAKAQLQNRFGASVAEVDHHELWQRCALVVACAAREAREAEELAAGAEREPYPRAAFRFQDQPLCGLETGAKRPVAAAARCGEQATR